jgi:hypothetical protein
VAFYAAAGQPRPSSAEELSPADDGRIVRDDTSPPPPILSSPIPPGVDRERLFVTNPVRVERELRFRIAGYFLAAAGVVIVLAWFLAARRLAAWRRPEA